MGPPGARARPSEVCDRFGKSRERRSPIDTDRRQCRTFTREDIDRIPHLAELPRELRETMKAVSAVLPFRVNSHVLESLIDWSRVPDDPLYRLVFPQPGMLLPHQLSVMQELVARGAEDEALEAAALAIRGSLNAHPAGQRSLNVPTLDGVPLPGLQHKYRETVLFFPSAGQSCHAYCSYCFRWAQFTGAEEFRFAAHESESLVRYLRVHPEVTNVLITGGDPLVMTTERLRDYLEPLLDPGLEHIRSIRIGTKSLTYWPQRFVSDADADDLLRLFEEVKASGRHLALMAHVSHPRELEPEVTRAAVLRIRGTGAVIRTQSPVVRGVNDDPDTWGELWRTEVQLGMVPYYFFVARDTGAQHYFKIPLLRALEIYQAAYRQVSGLARTVRGPVMSATPGKVLVDGVARVAGEDAFVLKFMQGRDPSWVGRPFFARLDPEAAWLDELRPAFDRAEFFFEPRFREIRAAKSRLQLEGTRWGPPPAASQRHRGRTPASLPIHHRLPTPGREAEEEEGEGREPRPSTPHPSG